MTDAPTNSPQPAPAAPIEPRSNSPLHQPVPQRVERMADNFVPVRPSTPPTPPTDAEYDRWTSAEKQQYARAATAAASTAPAAATSPESKPAGLPGNIGTIGVVPLGEIAEDGTPRFKIGEGDSAIDVSEKQLRGLMERHALEASRLASLPADPSGYQLKLPADLKLPEGVQFQFNEADPIAGPQLAAARQFAHDNGFSQPTFERMLSLYAGAQANEAAKIAEANKREKAALGVAGPARVNSVNTWLDSQGVPNLKGRMWTAQDVADFERLMSRFTNGGGATFTSSHRDVPDGGGISDAMWSRMSFAEKQDYARSHPQPQPNGRGR